MTVSYSQLTYNVYGLVNYSTHGQPSRIFHQMKVKKKTYKKCDRARKVSEFSLETLCLFVLYEGLNADWVAFTTQPLDIGTRFLDNAVSAVAPWG